MGNRSTNPRTGDNIRVDGHLVSFFNSNFKTQLAGTNARTAVPITATGGTKTTPGNGYIYHTFATASGSPDTSQTFVKSAGTNAAVEILLVGGGGGGGGGQESGGGGGAGGVAYGTGIQLDDGTYPLEIGSGGAKGPYTGASSGDGGNSSFNAGAVMPGEFGTFIAYGGGGGGGQQTPTAPDVQPGRPGGSGGGSSGTDSSNGDGGTATMPTTTPVNPASYFNVYGNNGGATTTTNGDVGSGGGGAGGAGVSISSGPVAGGKGGISIAIPAFPGPIISPHPLISADTANAIGPTGRYGEGGSGGSNVPNGTSPNVDPAPSHGGGRGATPSGAGTFGLDNGGGGGGGGNGGGYGSQGGGYGLVAIRYLEQEP